MLDTQKITVAIAPVLLTCLLLFACNEQDLPNNVSGTQNDEHNTEQDESSTNDSSEEEVHEPVTLTVGNYRTALNDEEFETFMKDPIEDQFPHITLEYTGQINAGALEEVLLAQQLPDIIYHGLNPEAFGELNELEINIDMTEYVEAYNIDLSIYDPSLIDAIYKNGNGKLISFPFAANVAAVFYNKDIFDRFAVPYPQDGMYWQDLLDLHQQLTREEDGVQYYGIHPDLSRYTTQASLDLVDTEQGIVPIDTDEIKEAADLLSQFYQTPGFREAIEAVEGNINQRFSGDQVTAMNLQWLNNQAAHLQQVYEEIGDSFRWDIVTFPFQEEKEGIASRIAGPLFAISTLSENKEEAFQAIAHTGTIDVQRLVNHSGRFTALTDLDLRTEYAADFPAWQNKNLENVTNVQMAPLHENITQYDSLAAGFINEVDDRLLEGAQDVGTILREVQEEANIALQEEISHR